MDSGSAAFVETDDHVAFELRRDGLGGCADCFAHRAKPLALVYKIGEAEGEGFAEPHGVAVEAEFFEREQGFDDDRAARGLGQRRGVRRQC